MKWLSNISIDNNFNFNSLKNDENITQILTAKYVYKDISVDNTKDIIFKLEKHELAIISVNNNDIWVKTNFFNENIKNNCAVCLTMSHGICNIYASNAAVVTILVFYGDLCDILFKDFLLKRFILFKNISTDIKLFVSSISKNTVEIYNISSLSYTFLLSIRKSYFSNQIPYPIAVEAALSIIEEDYAFLEGVQDLAERVEVSVGHLTRLFKKSIGLSPNQCITQFRIARSKQLLLDNSLSISMVAQLCGFSNSNYFAKVFKNEVGISPSEYIKTKNKRFKNDNSEIYIL